MSEPRISDKERAECLSLKIFQIVSDNFYEEGRMSPAEWSKLRHKLTAECFAELKNLRGSINLMNRRKVV